MERSKWLKKELKNTNKELFKEFLRKKISLRTTDITARNYPNTLKPKKIKATSQTSSNRLEA